MGGGGGRNWPPARGKCVCVCVPLLLQSVREGKSVRGCLIIRARESHRARGADANCAGASP